KIILPNLVKINKSLYIGRWPVTRSEFACFLNAGGYQKEEYWPTLEARDWLNGRNVYGGQMSTRIELWRKIKNNTNWKNELLIKGISPDRMKRFEILASMSFEELKNAAEKELPQKPRDRPASWFNPRHKNPSQPVVGITWFEANAFCLWLSNLLN